MTIIKEIIMRRNLLIFFVSMIAIAFAVNTAHGQITLSIPGLPKITKSPKPSPSPAPQTNGESASGSQTAASGQKNSAQNDNIIAKAPKRCEEISFYVIWNKDIQATIDDVMSFTPGRGYFVRDFNDDENRYLKMALSEEQRKRYQEGWADEDAKRCVNARLDELKAIADPVIGGYTPAGYTLGTPAEKALLKAAVTNLNTATVHQVGIKNNQWKIFYNDLGIPTSRKKFGALWIKQPFHNYCQIVWVNIRQPYAGGGTFGANEFQFVSWEYAGCPVGK